MASALYANRDNQFTVTVLDTDGVTVIPAATYSNAQYRVYRNGDCTPLISKSLGSGITVNGDNFFVVIDDTEITFSGTNGEYKHSFTVGATASELLPSVFDEFVDIVAGCPV